MQVESAFYTDVAKYLYCCSMQNNNTGIVPVRHRSRSNPILLRTYEK